MEKEKKLGIDLLKFTLKHIEYIASTIFQCKNYKKE